MQAARSVKALAVAPAVHMQDVLGSSVQAVARAWPPDDQRAAQLALLRLRTDQQPVMASAAE